MSARRRALAAAPLAFVLLAAACGTTRVTSEWRDEAFGSVPFRKVLVVFQNADASLRRVAEDEMARDIPNATPAHAVLRDDELDDAARVKARVRSLGFDTSVVMRVVGVDHERTYVPGRVYAMPGYAGGFWGDWGYGWTRPDAAASLRPERAVRIATNVYAVETDKLVWSSESETFRPASVRTTVDEVVRATARRTARAMAER